MRFNVVLAACAITALASGTARAQNKPLTLLTGSELKESWRVVDEMKDHGPVLLQDGVLRLDAGQPMTGVAFIGKDPLPLNDYEVSFQARRIEGDDFFAALTFPVRDKDTAATWVIGGWGGKCVGISSIQYQAADENETTSWVEFETGKWYTFRLQVRENRLTGFIDDKQIFDADTEGKKISMRFGDIEFCRPLGFATYSTVGEIKNLKITKLPAP
ncbi:MAG: DUF1080 domain-containing protein [Verrucomicrobiales bacterium]